MRACFSSSNIMLPRKATAEDAWAVVACDQYTSQPEYWEDVERIVEGKPSTLNIIFPEVYLPEIDERIARIRANMEDYLKENILSEAVYDGFVLVERTTESGTRLGLVGKVDLESYDFTPGNGALIRATEGTVTSRIPPRVRIRSGAIIESPHVMMLIDDREKKLIEPLYEKRSGFAALYDATLMKGGGRVRGYAIEGEEAEAVNALLLDMQRASGGFFISVGDGNHSLVTAKSWWDELKGRLSPEEREGHPARYALAELVNLHSPALRFEPVHRVLFGVDAGALYRGFIAYCGGLGVKAVGGDDLTFKGLGLNESFSLEGAKGRLPVDILQGYLDGFLAENEKACVDYIHGEETPLVLSEERGNCAIFLKSLDKRALFPAIAAGGVLPRKTFSMGEAHEKRYYMECRKIR